MYIWKRSQKYIVFKINLSEKSTRNNVNLKIMIFKRFSIIFQSGIGIYFEKKGTQSITTSIRKNQTALVFICIYVVPKVVSSTNSLRFLWQINVSLSYSTILMSKNKEKDISFILFKHSLIITHIFQSHQWLL